MFKRVEMIDLIVTWSLLIGCLKLFPRLYKEVHNLDVEEYEDIIYLSDCCGNKHWDIYILLEN